MGIFNNDFMHQIYGNFIYVANVFNNYIFHNAFIRRNPLFMKILIVLLSR